MLDYFAVFTRGGALLWTLQFTALRHNPLDALNALIRTCLLEERSSEQTYTFVPKAGAHQALKWTFHNVGGGRRGEGAKGTPCMPTQMGARLRRAAWRLQRASVSMYAWRRWTRKGGWEQSSRLGADRRSDRGQRGRPVGLWRLARTCTHTTTPHRMAMKLPYRRLAPGNGAGLGSTQRSWLARTAVWQGRQCWPCGRWNGTARTQQLQLIHRAAHAHAPFLSMHRPCPTCYPPFRTGTRAGLRGGVPEEPLAPLRGRAPQHGQGGVLLYVPALRH